MGLRYWFAAVVVAGGFLAGASGGRTASERDLGEITFSAFADDGNRLYVVDANGGRVTRIGTGDEPEWSPDGSMIAFVRDARVHVMNADGSDVRRIPAGPGKDDFSPSWSRNGARLLFSRGGVGFWLMDANGRNLRLVWRDTRYLATSPDWSPDGRTIAFDKRDEIYRVGIDGRGERRLTRQGDALAPRWSPDGKRIAYCTPGGIFVMNANGSNTKRLTTRYLDCHPEWSPDGRSIAFRRCCEGKATGFYVINLDGTGLRQVVRGYEVNSISWRP